MPINGCINSCTCKREANPEKYKEKNTEMVTENGIHNPENSHVCFDAPHPEICSITPLNTLPDHLPKLYLMWLKKVISILEQDPSCKITGEQMIESKDLMDSPIGIGTCTGTSGRRLHTGQKNLSFVDDGLNKMESSANKITLSFNSEDEKENNFTDSWKVVKIKRKRIHPFRRKMFLLRKKTEFRRRGEEGESSCRTHRSASSYPSVLRLSNARIASSNAREFAHQENTSCLKRWQISNDDPLWSSACLRDANSGDDSRDLAIPSSHLRSELFSPSATTFSKNGWFSPKELGKLIEDHRKSFPEDQPRRLCGFMSPKFQLSQSSFSQETDGSVKLLGDFGNDIELYSQEDFFGSFVPNTEKVI